MSSIRLIYGSSTGNTFRVAHLLAGELKDLIERVTDIAHATPRDFQDASALLLGVSTWEDGKLQQDWKRFFPRLDDVDLRGKTVALYGLGDAQGYSGEFVSALGTLYHKVAERGAHVVGFWPANDYTFERSDALVDGQFVGLVIDQENESHKTKQRVREWAHRIRPHFEQAATLV
jgi:flavodoxin I